MIFPILAASILSAYVSNDLVKSDRVYIKILVFFKFVFFQV